MFVSAASGTPSDDPDVVARRGKEMTGQGMEMPVLTLAKPEGGVNGWEKRIPFRELKQLVDESEVLDLRRERTRSGEIVVHLMYPETEEKVPCEVFRARLKLPS